MIKKYIKHYEEIEAIQWNIHNTQEVINFCNGNCYTKIDYMIIYNDDDYITADLGDFIYKDKNGNYISVSPDLFSYAYQEVK